MKEFRPSQNFVSRVMDAINAEENNNIGAASLPERLISFRLTRYALSAGGFVIGVWNLFRLYFSVFAPSICR